MQSFPAPPPLTCSFFHLFSPGQKELASRLLRVEPLFGFGAIARGLFVVAGADAMRGFSKIRLADNTTTAAAAEEEDDFDCIEVILADCWRVPRESKGPCGS